MWQRVQFEMIFQRLVSEGVANVGLETMKEIKNRIREGIIQQDLEDLA